MATITQNTLRKLVLAKQMFTIAQHNARKGTDVERMQAILNLDFCVGALVISSILDSGSNPKTNRGRSKNWDELVTHLSKFYHNQVMIADIDNLHDLRNSIQHGDVVPSDSDINRHIQVARSFFDDVCADIYGHQIAFETVSIAQLLKSPNEKEIILLAERFASEGNYPLSMMYLQIAVLYRYLLIKNNIFHELLPPSPSAHIVDENHDQEIIKQINYIEKKVDRALMRLSMGEHYMRALDFMTDPATRPLTSEPFYIPDLEGAFGILQALQPKDMVSQKTIESAFIAVHSILLGTEHLITEKLVLDSPIISGMYFTDILSTCATANFLVSSGRPIIECSLVVSELKGGNWVEIQRIPLPHETGSHSVAIRDLMPESQYKCAVEVSQPTTSSRSIERAWNIGMSRFKTASSGR